MRFTSVVAVISTAVAAVSAAEFNITVGKDNANTFDPPQITGVQQGDVVRFRFVSKSHSATQSTFDQPCQSKAGGVDSGFLPVAAGATTFPEWSIQINNVTAPMWFYCARAPHCTASGMVFAINPTAERTFAAFQAKATGGAGAGTNSSSTASGATPASTGGTNPGTAGPGGAGVGNGSSTTTPPSGAASSLHGSSAVTMLAGAAVLAGLWL
jgi:hypothetical protein